MQHKRTIVSGICLTTLILAFNIHGASILIDFGTSDISSDPDFGGSSTSTYRGLSTSGNWNNLKSGSFTGNLIDSTGATTTIDFGPEGMGASDSFNGPGYTGQLTGWAGLTNTERATALNTLASDTDALLSGALGDLAEGSAAMDFYSSTDGRFQIQQVTLGQEYDLSFYSSKKFPADDTDTTINVFDDELYTNLLGSITITHGSGGTPNTDTLGTISGLVGPSNVNNIFYVQFEGASGGTGYINAMSITAVPEPSTFALFALSGLAGIIAYRRRK